MATAPTSEEQQVVLAYAARVENRSRHWHVFRWLAVACFIVGLGLLLAVGRMSMKMHTMFELPPQALKIPEDGSSRSVENSLRLLAAHGEAQVVALRAEFYLLLKALLAAGIGTALFVYAVSDWRRDRRDRLFVRLLRSFVSDVADTKRES